MIVISKFFSEFCPLRVFRTKRILAECYFFERESWLSLPAASRLENKSLAPVVRISHSGEAIFFAVKHTSLSWTVSKASTPARAGKHAWGQVIHSLRVSSGAVISLGSLADQRAIDSTSSVRRVLPLILLLSKKTCLRSHEAPGAGVDRPCYHELPTRDQDAVTGSSLMNDGKLS